MQASNGLRIVLFQFPGGGSTVGVAALRERGAEVITVALDLGEGQELEALRDGALAGGAVRAHVLDAREEFVQAYQLPALKAGVLADSSRAMSADLARLIAAQKTVEIARIEAASAVACCGDGASNASFVRAVRTLEPALDVVDLPGSPMTSPGGRTHKVNGEYPPEPAAVEITFNRGEPAAINSVEMPLVDVVSTLGTIASVHGIAVPATTGGALLAPADDAGAAVVLDAAHRLLEERTVSPDLERVCGPLRREYAQLIADGRWFTPLRAAIDAFIDRAQETVSGTVRLKLFQGRLSAD